MLTLRSPLRSRDPRSGTPPDVLAILDETPTKRFFKRPSYGRTKVSRPSRRWAPDWLRSCESLTQLCGTLILKLTVYYFVGTVRGEDGLALEYIFCDVS